jgi:hypothetical protein
VLGVRATIWIGVSGSWAAGLWVLFSPLRHMRDVPGPGEQYGPVPAADPGPGPGTGTGSPAGPGRRNDPGPAGPAIQEP